MARALARLCVSEWRWPGVMQVVSGVSNTSPVPRSSVLTPAGKCPGSVSSRSRPLLSPASRGQWAHGGPVHLTVAGPRRICTAFLGPADMPMVASGVGDVNGGGGSASGETASSFQLPVASGRGSRSGCARWCRFGRNHRRVPPASLVEGLWRASACATDACATFLGRTRDLQVARFRRCRELEFATPVLLLFA
jgi:hypothetical protein